MWCVCRCSSSSSVDRWSHNVWDFHVNTDRFNWIASTLGYNWSNLKNLFFWFLWRAFTLFTHISLVFLFPCKLNETHHVIFRTYLSHRIGKRAFSYCRSLSFSISLSFRSDKKRDLSVGKFWIVAGRWQHSNGNGNNRKQHLLHMWK